jgi:hypothetical protein
MNAHEEFSPPKLDLDSLKQIGQKEVAGSGRKLTPLGGYATGRVIMINAADGPQNGKDNSYKKGKLK